MRLKKGAGMRISADHIFTGADSVEAGRLVIENGIIQEILAPGESDLHLENTLLSCGWVNSHVHLDLSLPRDGDRVPGSFEDWLGSVVQSRRALGEELKEISAKGIEESIAAGTTAVFDIDPEGHVLDAIQYSDLKRVIFREVIALTREDDNSDAWIEFLNGTTDPRRELRALSPHSPYTVHPEILNSLIQLSAKKRLPWAMHIAEAAWERELLDTGTGPGAKFLQRFGADPSEFVRKTNLLKSLGNPEKSSPGLIIHGNHCTTEEMAMIAESGSALVWCPSSHAYFNRPPHPAPQALSQGVPVLLGTDGQISAGHLSMLKEMNSAQKAAPTIPAIDLWRMVTTAPREWLSGLGQSHLLGSGKLQAGDPADLVAVSVPQGSGGVLERALNGKILGCWIDGRVKTWEAPE
ncbi:MAG TPA: hypothetical protein DGU45_09890 [Planctomycetes bacterium]|nr:amidohydrolase family protein [Planctomycetota bacterium]HCW45605.1 hypothetical protein [Planctomycetota bacterium]